MSRLLLVRHGETELQSSLRYWGSTDVPLNALGLRQAECLRRRLETEKIDFICSSNLQRAMATAQVIATEYNLPVTACPELREIDFGKLEGLTYNEISRLYPDVARLWAEMASGLAYPGGESLTQLDERVKQFINHLDKHNEAETGLIVAHSGVLRALLCRLMGLESRQRWQIRLDLASVSIIETYNRVAILTLLNDTCHLAERS